MTQKYRVVLVLFALLVMVSNSSFSAFAQTGDIDPNGSVPASCVTLSSSLRYKDTDASTGGAVSNLQEFLIAKGYMNTEATGFFGSITFASVQKYQAAKGLSTSGFVGDYTRAAIKMDSCSGNGSTVVTSSNGPVTMCTADAKQCADGSWVGRTGPGCQFVCSAPTTSTTSSSRNPSGYIVSQGNNGNTCSIILGRSTCAVTISWASSDYALTPKPVALVSCETNGSGCVSTEERYEGTNGARSFTLRSGIQRMFSLIGYDFAGNLRKAMDLVLQANCTSGSAWNGSACVTSTGASNTAISTTSSSPCFVVGPSTTCSPIAATATPSAFTVNYSVKGDGKILTSLVSTIKGGGPDLKACTGQASARFVTGAGQVTPCSKDSDFAYLKNQSGWTYVASTDTYSFNGNVSASGFPDTTYFTNFILSNGNRETKLFSSSMTSTTPVASPSPTTTTPCFIVGPSTTCAPSTYVTPPSTSARVGVSNSPNGPFVVYAYNTGKIYSQLTGINKADNPRGCAQPAGVSTCLNPANFRTFTPAEWINNTTVVTVLDGGTIPNGYYDSYVMSNTQAPIKVASFTLYAAPVVDPSTYTGPVFGAGAGGIPGNTPVTYGWKVYLGSMLLAMSVSNTGNPEPTIPCNQANQGKTWFLKAASGTVPASVAKCMASNEPLTDFVPLTSSTLNVPGGPTNGLIANVSVTGNGNILTSMNSTIVGGGASLRACTARLTGKASGACSTDAEFAFLKNQAGWSYDPTSDTYNYNGDISSAGFPDVQYFTVYLLSNGTKIEKTFGTTNATPQPFAVNVSVTGNGSILTSMNSTIVGGGPNLRACTARLSGQASGACSTDAEFAYLKNQAGWSYNSSNDTYSYNGDVSSAGFPDVAYFSVYILPDGSRSTKVFNQK